MDRATLIIHHLFTALSLVIMTMRLFCRRILFHEFNAGDYLTMLAMICATARDALIHVVLTWGTNNISAKTRHKIHFTPEEIYRRTVGSQLAIANRPVYNTYLWLQKLALLDFYLRTFHPDKIRSRYILWTYSSILVATWIPAQIVGFTECVPFHMYWQVVPPPGRCVQAQIQLKVLASLNIATEVMLLALPLPVLISLQTPFWTKVRLSILCTLGLFIIILTVIRLPINVINSSTQTRRSLWASVELLAAAIVVNAPILYGFFNRLGQEKTLLSRSRQEKSSRLRMTSSTKESDAQLYIQRHTSVISESTHYLNCQDQEGIVMTTVEGSSRNTSSFMRSIELSLLDIDYHNSENGKKDRCRTEDSRLV